jgi:hypothetical protein
MKQNQALCGLVVCLLLAVSPARAQSFEGCGTFIRGVECVLFESDSGHLYLTDGFDPYQVGDRVAIKGTPWSCLSVCVQEEACLTIETIGPCPSPDCCLGQVGDVNGLSGDYPTIGDLSTLLEVLFIVNDVTVLGCLAEADINGSGGADPQPEDITIGDVAHLIDYLFITGPGLGLPDCM